MLHEKSEGRKLNKYHWHGVGLLFKVLKCLKFPICINSMANKSVNTYLFIYFLIHIFKGEFMIGKIISSIKLLSLKMNQGHNNICEKWYNSDPTPIFPQFSFFSVLGHTSYRLTTFLLLRLSNLNGLPSTKYKKRR